MPEYQYVAQTSNGSIERGRIGATSRSDAREKLSQIGRRLIGIDEAGDTASVGRILAAFRGRRFTPNRSSDLELMLRQLAVMLESGLELSSSLRELSLHSPKRRQRQLCVQLADAVEQGNTFASALTESRSFPPVIAQLVRVGEDTGELSIMLQRAAEFIENRRQAFTNLLAVLAYPLIVAIAACSLAIYLVGWAIPKLTLFLNAMGRELPAMTQSLLDVSSLVQAYGAQLLVILVTAMVAISLIYAWGPGRYRIDEGLLRLPLLGSLMGMAETHQLASALAIMLRSGVFLPEALETAATLHRNRYLAARVARSLEQLSIGKDLAGSFRGPGFGPMLSSMIAVGERTGELPKALELVAKFYATVVDSRIKGINKLVEPAIIVIVGGMVGYVYIAFFMALMSAGGNFK